MTTLNLNVKNVVLGVLPVLTEILAIPVKSVLTKELLLIYVPVLKDSLTMEMMNAQFVYQNV